VSRFVIIWSGGADSTALLDYYAGSSSEDYPTIALSVSGHPYLSKAFVRKQNEVQKRYLKHAKGRGYHIRHERMRFSGNFEWGDAKSLNQAVMWLSAIIQVIKDKDQVLMGYIRRDDFWHYRREYEDAFRAACLAKGIEAKIGFPFEWDEKADILRRLKKAKVPDSCWFTCERTKAGKACGTCNKCTAVIRAWEALKKEEAKPRKDDSSR
jgi:7-cyano-7-deazaguanine synthase in queuosine biosynthesis